MKKNTIKALASILVLLSFALSGNIAWALKNVCPDCKVVIENLDLTSCPDCDKAINKCLVCGTVNPIRNDNCLKCNASLAESRVLMTIDQATRENLKLGESDRAKIEVELQQIDEEAAIEAMTPKLAARQIELLTQMGWWSKANTMGIEFATKFADAEQKPLVEACRVTALRNLGFLAKEAKNFNLAIDYLKTAMAIDPKDKKSANLLKMSRDALKKSGN